MNMPIGSHYCIMHEALAWPRDFDGHYSSECLWVECPPPDFEILIGDEIEPSEDELILMDMNAEVLLADFEDR